MKITLDILKSEYCGLKQIAAKQGISLHDLLAAFVSDVTCSQRSGGSDERDIALSWVHRRCFTFLWHRVDFPEDQTERNLRLARSERWYAAERRAQYREDATKLRK